eukprot:4372680-Pleurochrysis_carterae.AAC.2
MAGELARTDARHMAACAFTSSRMSTELLSPCGGAPLVTSQPEATKFAGLGSTPLSSAMRRPAPTTRSTSASASGIAVSLKICCCSLPSSVCAMTGRRV